MKSVSPEILSQELFFHEPGASQAVESLLKGDPLFCLRGRATLERGNLHSDDTLQLVFRIPVAQQKNWLEKPFDSGFEDFAWGSNRYIALKKSVPPWHMSAALRWFDIQEQTVYEKNRITVGDIRYLPTKFLINTVGPHEIMAMQGDKLLSIKVSLPNTILNTEGISEEVIINATQHYFKTKRNP